MASLDRAYGYRGAIIALGMAGVAGGVHGVFAHSFDYLAVKLVIGLAGSVVLIMAGAISARHHAYASIGLGLLMGFLFFITRWGTWSLMEGGMLQTLSFLSTPPWAWPGYLADFGISGFWMLEVFMITGIALLGCILGQERAE